MTLGDSYASRGCLSVIYSRPGTPWGAIVIAVRRRVGILALALVASTLTVGFSAPTPAASAAPEASAVEQPGWSGTLSIEFANQWANPDPYYTTGTTGSAAYTSVHPIGNNKYGADGEIRQTGTVSTRCYYTDTYKSAVTELAAPGPFPREDDVETYAFSLIDDGDSALFLPGPGGFPATNTQPCTESGVPQVQGISVQFANMQSNTGTPQPSRLREDLDPDPNHLQGTTEFTLEDPPDPGILDVQWDYYSYKITYDLRRTDLTDSCDDPGVEEHYTSVDGAARVVVALAPDPDLGNPYFGVLWCLTDAGARIDKVPSYGASLTQNWILLATLEYFGIKFEQPSTPKIDKRLRNVRFRATYKWTLDWISMVGSFFPAGKFSETVGKAFKQTVRRIRSADGAAQKRRLAAAFDEKLGKWVRELRDDFGKKLKTRIRRNFPGTGKQKDAICNAITTGFAKVSRAFKAGAAKGVTEVAPDAASEWIFGKMSSTFGGLTRTFWSADATFYLADNGSSVVDDTSKSEEIALVEVKWKQTRGS